MESRYRLSCLATSYASLLRFIRTRRFAHPRVGICHLNQHVTLYRPVNNPHLARTGWIARELETALASIHGRNHGNGHTRNLQEMAPAES